MSKQSEGMPSPASEKTSAGNETDALSQNEAEPSIQNQTEAVSQSETEAVSQNETEVVSQSETNAILQNERDTLSQNETEIPSENKVVASETKNDSSNKGSRYAKTFQLLQGMGLLDYAMQLAKLCKENEQLQQKINKLEMDVNEHSRKTQQGMKRNHQEVSQAAKTGDDVPTT